MDLKELSEFYDESMDFDEFIHSINNLPKHTDSIKQEQDAEYLKSEQLDREKKKKEPNPKQDVIPNPKVESIEPNPTDDPKPTLKELRELRVKHLEK
jgi:hypothetical protein